MKITISFILACAMTLLAGCSHFRTFTVPLAQTPGAAHVAPVEVSEFWKTNGFTLVDRTKSPLNPLYSPKDGSTVLAVWEKWYKGVVFPYSGAVWAAEKIKGDQYRIELWPVASQRDGAAAQIAHALKEYLAKRYPNVPVEFKSKGFVDLR